MPLYFLSSSDKWPMTLAVYKMTDHSCDSHRPDDQEMSATGSIIANTEVNNAGSGG
jgi:hypothetical protein